MRFHPAKRPAPRRGFALLITITLLAFLVLLLVSLASLTRVETQVATNNQDIAKARQNAMMALNIALGELQKYTGPDQRTTARSDMDTALANTTTASGRWLGAYGNGVPVNGGATDKYSEAPSVIAKSLSDYYAANSAYPLAVKGSQARLLNWLVSGNEDTAFDPANNVSVTGQITASPTSFSFVPSGTVANLATGTALSNNITVTGVMDGANGAQPARLLVGPNSVSAPADYVAAPLVKIAVPATSLPGAAGSAAITVGRYAWWVGDEGAKARINLPKATAAQAPLAFVSSQRAAIELVDGKNPVGTSPAFTPADVIGSAYDPAAGNLKSVIMPTLLPLLSPANASALTTAIKYRYHDLTGYSNSVLSDTYAGGLKKDLSAVLATGATTPADTAFIFAPEPNTASDGSNDLGLPTWGQLRSFTQTLAPAGSLATNQGLTPQVPTMTKIAAYGRPVPTNVGISPVLTYTLLGYRYLAPDGDVDGGRIVVGIYPMVVLWNPYTTDMLPARYEVGIQRPEYAKVELQGHAGAVPNSYVWTSADVLETRELGVANGTSNPYFRFIVDNSKGIPAGQSLVFTLDTTGSNYSAVNASATLTNDYNPLNCVYIPTPLRIGTAPVPPAGGTYRVGVNNNANYKSYASAFVSQTYFTAPGTYNPFSWGGNGSQYSYLGAVAAVSAKPTGGMPYAGSAFTSWNWYQMINWVNSTSLVDAPFGPNVGFPSDPLAGSTIKASEGFPAAEVGKWRALLQPAAALEPAATPSWRMHVKANFAESGSRWIAQHNPRGFISTNMKLTGVANFTGAGYSVTTWPPINLEDTGDRVVTSSGESLRSTTTNESTLFEFRPDTVPLLAIGQLQHANLGWFGAIPSYAIGNSVGAPPFGNGIQGAAPTGGTAPATVASLVALQSSSTAYANGAFSAFYDHSWLLNRNLWDRYFVSTVPNRGTGTASDSATTATTAVPTDLPNPRHTRYNIDASASAAAIAGKLRNADTAAAHLMLSGGFNINSTSEQAWRAVLAGSNQLSYDPTGASVGGSAYNKAVFSRFSKPTTNDTTSVWKGYRKLTDEQVAQLAKDIVKEIRARGPFVSMGDFINRRLYDVGVFPATPADKRFKGTLQAALDSTTTGTGAINNGAPSTPVNRLNTPLAAILPTGQVTNPFNTGTGNNGLALSTAPVSAISSFAPQFLTQADVLSTIGSGLSARSDTFVVRTYGEVLDPVNSTAATPVITGRAWCEAVVQRLPDYVNDTMTPETLLDTATASVAKTTNQAFGRKFKIISFRWLTPQDI